MGINKIFNCFLQDTITIDPGRNTGIAVWDGNACPWTYEINTPKKYTGISMLSYLHSQFYLIISQFVSLKKAIIEGVDFREDSLVSRTAAVRGDLSILSYVVGTYVALLRENNSEMDIRILTAREWKGNLTKEATTTRVRLINGLTYTSDHITDAVAIGFSQTKLWRLGCDK